MSKKQNHQDTKKKILVNNSPCASAPLREKKDRSDLLRLYRLLLSHFGPRHWWPADTPFEVMVGAILTQNTAWSNVEKAIASMKAEDVMTPESVAAIDIRKLRQLIRSSGYYNQKADRLKLYVRYFLAEYGGAIKKMAAEDTAALRSKLLALKGIGPETADSILLYALGKPVFVVDAYTRRAFARLGFIPPDADYHSTQQFFTARLPRDLALYNDFHAQIVYLGKDYCRTKPRCDACPLQPLGRCIETTNEHR
jgi:endonuclease III related protein